MVVAGALSKGQSKLANPLLSEDTESTACAVKALGAKVNMKDDCWEIEGADPIRTVKKPIDCGESGATLRFMIPVAALAAEPSVFLLGKGLEKRPLKPFLESLRQIGAQTELQTLNGKASVWVQGGGISGGETSLPGNISSQFVSGLMFACPLAKADTHLILTTPLESKSYVRMTEDVLDKHAIKVEVSKDTSRITIPAKQTYRRVNSIVPGDYSSAAFLLAAAAVTNSDVSVDNLDYGSIQGDKAILRILKNMGVKGRVCGDQVEITGDGGFLSAVNIDAKNIPDLVPVCAALACQSKGTSRIHDAKRLRLKESDRLSSLFSELRKMGASVAIDESSLTVKGPCRLHGATIDPHDDHRIAMACAVAALRAEGETVIQNADCVRKSYPHFFTDLRTLGADVIGGEFIR
jgi:3-phosphoshikimate 1-carboxyvinyltransferase